MDKLYTITLLKQENAMCNASVKINASHNIFDGHFPQNPIVPGVCLVEMIKSVLIQSIKKEVKLVAASKIKFLKIVNPNENNVVYIGLDIKHEQDKIMVNAKIYKEMMIFVKFKGEFC